MEVSTQPIGKAYRNRNSCVSFPARNIKVEHRLFCYISKNWQGKPLIDIETAINLIGSTTTETGLKVICQRDDTVYELAKTVSDEDLESISIEKIAPFENWNYLIRP